MGEKTAEILIGELINKTPIQEVKLPVELIVRESTATINKHICINNR
jgi:DNA-binding LacI/PurR family transcriptional regulator